MMLARILVFCAALLWAGVAVPQTWTNDAAGAGGACGPGIGPKETCYLYLTNTSAGDSPIFTLTHFADVAFDPDLLGTGTATGEITIEKCIGSAAGVNYCETLCVDVDGDGAVDDGILDGDSGEVSGEQRATTYDLGPGTYYIATPTNPGAGELAVVTVRGHE